MEVTVAHLFDCPAHLPHVAALIWREFWMDKPGVTASHLEARLRQATRAEALPLCLVALQGDVPLGVVNLVDNDDEDRTHWHPWLAGLVVEPAHRGRGIGSLLVQALLDEARRLGFASVYFGTDGPGFYRRLGAKVQEQLREDFCFMRFDAAALSFQTRDHPRNDR